MFNVKKRILYLNIIKVFALLFVIFNHSHNILISSYMYIRIIHNSLFYLSKSAVPLFLMVSGVLLMEKKDSIPKLIKRILRVIIPHNNIYTKKNSRYKKHIIVNNITGWYNEKE